MQFPFFQVVDQHNGPSFNYLPSVWTHDLSGTTISINPLASDGSVGASSGTVTTGQGVSSLFPGQPPVSYTFDPFTNTVYGYGVNSSGGLTSLGSFNPFLQNGLSVQNVAPFPPLSFTSGGPPKALIVYEGSNSTGYISIYSVGLTGMPASNAMPEATFFTPSGRESFLILQNDQVEPYTFGQ